MSCLPSPLLIFTTSGAIHPQGAHQTKANLYKTLTLPALNAAPVSSKIWALPRRAGTTSLSGTYMRLHRTDSNVSPQKLRIVLIRPSKYDDEGYVIRHLRGVLPSNILACLSGLTEELREKRALG